MPNNESGPLVHRQLAACSPATVFCFVLSELCTLFGGITHTIRLYPSNLAGRPGELAAQVGE